MFTGTNGRFELVVDTGDVVGLAVAAEDAPRLIAGGDVDLGDLTLTSARAIRGVVRDGSGNPAANVDVHIGERVVVNADRGRIWFGHPGYQSPTTDGSGRFGITRVGSARHTVLAVATDPDRFAVGVVDPGTEDQEVRLTLVDSGCVAFRVGDIPIDTIELESAQSVCVRLKRNA